MWASRIAGKLSRENYRLNQSPKAESHRDLKIIKFLNDWKIESGKNFLAHSLPINHQVFRL